MSRNMGPWPLWGDGFEEPLGVQKGVCVETLGGWACLGGSWFQVSD